MGQIDQSIHMLERFLARKERLRREHPLRYLFWEATLRCNLDCLHCGSDCYKDNRTAPDELDVTLIKDELTAIAECCDPKKITFAIIGGEPLLRPDIIEVGATAADLGYFWGVTTNGMLLNKKTIRQLKDARPATISVSLDGLKQDHDRLRNCPGAYQTVTAGIRQLVAMPFYKKFDVICCVSKLNINTLDPFVQRLIALKVPALRFVPVFSRGRAVSNPHLMLDRDDYLTLLNFIAAKRQSEDRIRINLGEEGYWGPQWECRVRDNFHYCGSGINIGSILYNGDVMGCPSVSRKFIQGNIKKTSFLDIWKNGFYAYRKGRQDLFQDKCDGCDHWILCEGGGFHLLEQGEIGKVCNYRQLIQKGEKGYGKT
jgi:radical SAM protein with 4Fe4S-binding SPASM domain